ncbi:hypothetical protein CEXT_132891 [Caerostris extrusa]|uniref:Uncharacterized protein n=1 Tax=Caerostris extrusa TaxID=172846 RepID=A0AAV4NQG7_CAEEX|nr:hypothetical protein CEXT_132891 [Caerostris extrusa]
MKTPSECFMTLKQLCKNLHLRLRNWHPNALHIVRCTLPESDVFNDVWNGGFSQQNAPIPFKDSENIGAGRLSHRFSPLEP